jgi:hypothetical protein
MDEAEKLWRTEHRSHTSNNLSALSYLAIATGISGKDELGSFLAAKLRDLAQKMGLLGVQPTDELVSRFHCLPSDKIKSLAFAAWGAYAWLTSVVAIFIQDLGLIITVTVVSTTQGSQFRTRPVSRFLEISIDR